MRRLSLSMFALRVGALASVAALVSSCSLTASQLSCSLKNKTTGAVEKCVEYTDFAALTSVNAKASLAVLCNLYESSIEEKLCPAEMALVGCTDKNNAWTQTTWYFPTAMQTTAASVSCSGVGESRLGPDRKPAAPVTGGADGGASGGSDAGGGPTDAASSPDAQ